MKKTVFWLLALIAISFWGCHNDSAVDHFKASGTIEATTVTISSKVGGEILRTPAREGATVAADDTLLVIDAEELVLQRNQIQAQLDAADAQLRLALKGARDEDKRAAAKNAEAAKASLQQAKADLHRVQNLVEKGSATQKQLDDVQSLVEVRQAQYEAAEQQLEKLIKGAREEEIDMARAQKAQAEASLALIEKKIRDCTVTAPLAATLTEQLVEMGETVTPGQNLLTLADLSQVTLKVYIKEARLPQVQLEQTVRVTIDGDNREFEGQVSYIADEAEFTPKTIQTEDERVKLVYAVEIELPNADRILKAGMPADAYF